jgi:S-adenosylmethionine:tRNA ribosyltransferase-isomerase
MLLSDFDYSLPPELVAQTPADDRTGSRLLHLDGGTGALFDYRFSDLPGLMAANDVLVVNDTRVLKARLTGTKSSGGRVECLVERILDDRHALVQIRSSKAPREGAVLTLGEGFLATVIGRSNDLFHLRFESTLSVLDLLDRHGAVPLPPYIAHAPDAGDELRYQTVYAARPGAVAAPTAGLHFDHALLDALRARGIIVATITLHVGAGTFTPVRVENVSDHVMHGEWYDIPRATVDAIRTARARGGRVTAVGTTTLRALEGAAARGELSAGSGETNLFILPGYRFRVVERLITNFHLPRSTLLMLVSAFGGFEHVRHAYRHAVDARYRFFSYGDAMLIDRTAAAPRSC